MGDAPQGRQAEILAFIEEHLAQEGSLSWTDLFRSCRARIELVCCFLAILELFKQGLVELDQPAAFGDIEIIWTGSPALSVADLASIDTYDG